MARYDLLTAQGESPVVLERAEPSGMTTVHLRSVLSAPWNGAAFAIRKEAGARSTYVSRSISVQPNRYFSDSSPAGQRARLLDVLVVAPVTVLEAQVNLEIQSTHDHVDALRQDGYNIQASFCWVFGVDGERKCSVRYELQDGPYRPWICQTGARHD